LGYMRPERIPLFPLDVVLLPVAELPLHIFEPRYRQMVKDCLEEKSEFGMVLSMDKRVARVGCTAEIVQVAKRYPDGRMDILTIGRAPFRVVELFTADLLLEGQVDYLEDREFPTSPGIQRELVELFEACHTIIFDDYPKNLEGASTEDFSYLVAATLPMDLLWKQQILELRSEADRQERLVAYLREWAPHLAPLHRKGRDAFPGRPRIRRHGCPANRECPALSPQLYSSGLARPGQEPHSARPRQSARSGNAGRRGLRNQRRPF